jgi:hypothetical protein
LGQHTQKRCEKTASWRDSFVWGHILVCVANKTLITIKVAIGFLLHKMTFLDSIGYCMTYTFVYIDEEVDKYMYYFVCVCPSVNKRRQNPLGCCKIGVTHVSYDCLPTRQTLAGQTQTNEDLHVNASY